MKLEKITYRRLFPTGSYANEAIELSGTLEPNEDILNAYTQLHEMCAQLHFTKNKEFYEQTGEQVRDIGEVGGNYNSKSRQINSIREAINSATTLKTVEIFRKLVERENIPEITTIFEEKLKTFA